MVEIIRSIITNILIALYQPFWFSVALACMYMFFYLYATDKEGAGNGFKFTLLYFIRRLKNSIEFRRLFLLAFYVVMILTRTLLNRNMWMNPVSNVMGGWWLYNTNPSTGEVTFTTECFENLALFIPFSFIRLLYLSTKMKVDADLEWKTIKSVFVMSFSIEALQLFLRLGTVQVSDLFYNTLGGGIGVLIYKLYRLVDRYWRK